MGAEIVGFVTADRFIVDAKRTPVLLHALLNGVSQERAMAATDGPDGWSVVQVVGHLRDFEGFFRDRVELMLSQENPELPAYDHEALAIERDYQHQDLRAAAADLLERRRGFLALFERLSPEDYVRGGVHPENGPITVFDALVQLTHHDLTHLDQIARCLGLSDRLLGA
jgi:hypothetical protein